MQRSIQELMATYIAHNSALPFYLAHQLKTDRPVNKYNLCFSYRLGDEKALTFIIESTQQLISTKAHLRHTYTMENNEVIGHIHSTLPAEVNYYTTTKKQLSVLEQSLIKEPHDISSQSSIRLNIISLSDTPHFIIMFNINHILVDGTSLEQFIKDLNQLMAGNELIHEDATSYIKLLSGEKPLHRAEEMTPELNEYIHIVNHIAQNITSVDSSMSSRVLHCYEELPSKIYKELLEMSSTCQLSAFNLLILAWSVFDAKMNNQTMNLVYFPVTIRHDKTLSGCFINTLIFPLNDITNDTYKTLIRKMQNQLPCLKNAAKIQLYQQFNLGTLSSFASSHFAKPSALFIKNKSIESKAYAQIANAGVNIKYREHQDTLIFSADIFSGVMPDYVALSLLKRFFNFLNQLLSSPNQALLQIDLTFAQERKQVLCEFNQTTYLLPNNETVIDVFEDQVARTPEHTALVFEQKKMTYAQLNVKANQLAHYLQHCHQVKPDDLIALWLDRNEYTLIAILAVLKAGGAYVPLDISYPQERIEYILEDTQANMLIINQNHNDRLMQHTNSTTHFKNSALIVIDSHETQNELQKYDTANIINADTSSSLVYVIYTSGTTGKPKGVMVEHKNVLNTLHALFEVYAPYGQKPLKITAFTSYAFDVSVSEFFVPLLRGDELHLLSSAQRQDIASTSQYFIDQEIDYAYLPPVLLANLPRIKYPSLKAIIYAGEPCDAETAKFWSGKLKLYNYYGPTEVSIYATGLCLQSHEVHLIGKPIINTTAYILNTERLPQPIGVRGELFLGGQGVARGYLNQHKLTNERFFPNPFQTDEERSSNTNSRLYKTGDLVRWHPDGNIEYMGRNDFQIKIRGYRIELGEIESTLTSFPGIKQAVVLVKNHSDLEDNQTNHRYLVGYYVAAKKIEISTIQEYMSLHLPEYMQPRAFVHLKYLPVTPNGKLDKQALPVPELVAINYRPPTSEKEASICKAFEHILGLSKIGIEDDFFKLGGNSIMAIGLVAKLQNNFNINVANVYNFKTPKLIARDVPFIKNNLKNNLEMLRQQFHSSKKNTFDSLGIKSKLDQYYASFHQSPLHFESVPVNTILLTGATGFLGCNLLNTVLSTTQYTIFLIVRALNDSLAFERVNAKFHYYFDCDLLPFYNSRLFVYSGDIEQFDLGLSPDVYQLFVTKVDSIIHCAALTKHYGDYDTFYFANVQTTQNLLELSKQTKLKHFHYISTSSVLNEGYVPNCEQYVFTEDDDGDNLLDRSNIYVKTKYEGEKIVCKYRKFGVIGSIYRVGNLAFIAQNHRVQENIADNAFFTRLTCFIDLKMIATEIGWEEMSPADSTAQAIIKLFSMKTCENQTFHVFNPHWCNLAEILSHESALGVSRVTIDHFISCIIATLEQEEYNKTIELFLLHKRWLNEQNDYTTEIRIVQDKTQSVLKALGFEWQPITPQDIVKILKGRNHARSKNS